MNSKTIRAHFLSFFSNKGHEVVPSSKLVPDSDPSLMFTNAGMNQFKDVFMGLGSRKYTKAVSNQKCMRCGGKHNDIENVGKTSHHLTFFEMLGNFSFGNYFKQEAIQLSWEASQEVFGLDPNRISVSVLKGDQEAIDIWTNFVSRQKIYELEKHDNFWSMGDIGPCGPCSELYYDKGPQFGDYDSLLLDTSGDRFVEFWNLVFILYNMEEDGKLTPLSTPCIDTGVGLERILCLTQNVENVFRTDVLSYLSKAISIESGKKEITHGKDAVPFKVISDHIRSIVFAIADGAVPSNVNRGYVIRKLIRRAAYYGTILGFKKPFLNKLLPYLQDVMGSDFPEIVKESNHIAEILQIEEESFLKTLTRSIPLLKDVCNKALTENRNISGDEAFKLKDTYGVPLDNIIDYASGYNLSIDMLSFNLIEQNAKKKSKATDTENKQPHTFATDKTHFIGYDLSKTKSFVEQVIYDDLTSEDQLKQAIILLKETPFYPEQGGQIGDKGIIISDHAVFKVFKTVYTQPGIIGHKGVFISGNMSSGTIVTCEVDTEHRTAISINHTSTHLLQWALTSIIGEHIRQVGSSVNADRLRFDFGHHKHLSDDQLKKLEEIVCDKIRSNDRISTTVEAYSKIQGNTRIKQFFEDKYGEIVRIVSIGPGDPYSIELCCGTHANFTGDIGSFSIIKSGSIASGIHRIEAITGKQAEKFLRQRKKIANDISNRLKKPVDSITEYLESLLKDKSFLEVQIKQIRLELIRNMINNISDSETNNEKLIVKLEKVPSSDLRNISSDILKHNKNLMLIIIYVIEGDQCTIVCRRSKNCKHQMNELVKCLPKTFRGGGSPDIAQSSGPITHIESAIIEIKKYL